MLKKESQLLCSDLCARLPYGVICRTIVGDYRLLGIDFDREAYRFDSPIYEEGDDIFDFQHGGVKPYLRPMSSMTTKEWCEYSNSVIEDDKSAILVGNTYRFVPTKHREDWLNAHHLDYNGLIEKGLALPAPDGMYQTINNN